MADVRFVTGQNLLEIVQKITHTIAAERRCGVLLTSQAAAAVCLANRRRGVRATMGYSLASAAAATAAIGANLLVLDPAAHQVTYNNEKVELSQKF